MLIQKVDLGDSIQLMMQAPRFLKPYFWEIDFEKLDVKRRPQYVITRILEYGNLEAVRWLRRYFSVRQINMALRRTRQLSRKSALFWAVVQGIKKEEVLCLSKGYRQKLRSAWPY